MGKRSKARECAFQMLYQWDMSQDPVERVSNLFWKVRSSTDATKAMSERLFRGAQSQVTPIDAAITAASTNWRFERIAAVDKSILRIATYELMSERETPPTVVIDEAVELAKRFGEADSPPFINGVLDAVMRSLRGDAPKRARPPKKVRT